MIPLAPTKLWFGAPQRPLQLLISIGAIAAVLLFVLASTNAGGLTPGTAETKLTGSAATVSFRDGDRFFWITHAPMGSLTASDVTDLFAGDQSITKRTSFTSKDRVAYDEGGRHGSDFALEIDHLYEIAGVQSDATLEYEVRAGIAGKSFIDEIQQNSNGYLKRIWTQFKAIPGLIIEDLSTFKDDLKGLFSGKDSAGGEGAGTSAVKDIGRAWPLFVGIGVLVFAAPPLGFGPAVTGGMSGLMLMAGGSWPFYALGALAILIGIFSDPNMVGSRFIGGIIGAGIDGAGSARKRNPHIFAGIVIFTLGVILGLLAAWIGHPNLMALTMIVSGAAALFVMSAKAFVRVHDEDEYFYEEQIQFEKIPPAPALFMTLLSAVNAGFLFYLDYKSMAWAFLIFGTAMLSITLFRGGVLNDRREWRIKGAKSTDAYHAGRDTVRNTWRALGTAARSSVWFAVFMFWLAAAEFSRGNFIVGSGDMLVGVLLVAAVLGYKSWRHYRATKEAAT